MFVIVLTFVALDDLKSINDLGIVLTSEAVPFVAFLLVGGVAADRLSRRHILVVGDVLQVLAWGGLGILVVDRSINVIEVVITAVLSGVASALSSPTIAGLIPLAARAEDLQAANALTGVISAVSSLAGPALAGTLIELAGTGTTLLVIAGTYIIATVGALRLRIGREPGSREVGIVGDLRSGWKTFTGITWLWVSSVQFSLWNGAVYAVFLVAGAVEVKRFSGGATYWAAIQTALALGTLLGGSWSLGLRAKFPLRFGLLVSSVFTLVPLSLVLHMPTAIVLVASVSGGVGIAVVNSLWSTVTQRHVPAEFRSRVNAYDQLGSSVLFPIGLSVAGVTTAIFGVSAELWASVVFAIVLPLSLAILPSVSGLRSDRHFGFPDPEDA